LAEVPDSRAGQLETCPTCFAVCEVPTPRQAGPGTPAAGARDLGEEMLVMTGLRGSGTVYICPNPNCGYQGPAVRKARGSLAVAILLWVLFFPIGLVYALVYMGYSQTCPHCSGQLGGR
jgi:hypothetical protein